MLDLLNYGTGVYYCTFLAWCCICSGLVTCTLFACVVRWMLEIWVCFAVVLVFTLGYFGICVYVYLCVLISVIWFVEWLFIAGFVWVLMCLVCLRYLDISCFLLKVSMGCLFMCLCGFVLILGVLICVYFILCFLDAYDLWMFNAVALVDIRIVNWCCGSEFRFVVSHCALTLVGLFGLLTLLIDVWWHCVRTVLMVCSWVGTCLLNA